MFSRKVLKQRAKAVLSRSYFNILIACLIVSFVQGGGIGLGTNRLQGLSFEGMSNLRILAVAGTALMLLLVGILVYIFLIAPLSVGLKKLVLETGDGRGGFDNLAFPFKNGYKNIVLSLFMKDLYIFLWSIIGFMPFIVAIWKFDLMGKIETLALQIENDSISAAISVMGIAFLMFALTTLFSIPAYIKSLQYSQVGYILAEEPDATWRDVILRSKELMVGNKWAYVKLSFSFVGWYLAANIFCCIGNYLLMPYIETTFAELYLELCGRGKDRDSVFYQHII